MRDFRVVSKTVRDLIHRVSLFYEERTEKKMKTSSDISLFDINQNTINSCHQLSNYLESKK